MSSIEAQQRFGFKFDRSGAHSARTMMFAEIGQLFEGRGYAAVSAEYQEDVKHFNLLHKPSATQ